MKQWFQKKRPQTVLGLAFDGASVDAAVLRRTNGSVELAQGVFGALPADLREVDPEAAGRALRELLDKTEIRERRCVVALPPDWVLSLQTVLPELSEEDTQGLLQLEAENGFPYSPDELLIAQSRVRTEGGPAYVTQLAVERDNIEKLEQVLRAAKLNPVSFTLGVTAQQKPADRSREGVVALFVGERGVHLLITGGGGVVSLRSLGAVEPGDSGEPAVSVDAIARELRITLGQLAPAVRDELVHLRVFGGAAADRLAAGLTLRAPDWGLKLERVIRFAPSELGVKAPESMPVSAAAAVAGRYLAQSATGLEFLPPRVSAWQQFAGKAGSGKLLMVGKVAGAAVVLVLGLFAWQQVQLMGLRSTWSGMSAKVKELDGLQQQIRQFRPWYDESVRSLAVMRRLTEAFPENGNVTAKTLELRDTGSVICSGTATDNAALLEVLTKLRAMPEISNVQVDQFRGRAPLQFTFNFQWSGGPGQP